MRARCVWVMGDCRGTANSAIRRYNAHTARGPEKNQRLNRQVILDSCPTRAERENNMTKRNRVKAKLRLYPDPILKAVCEPVGDDEDVSGVIRDMMYILTNSKTGAGLAAPQAGHTKRVIIVADAGFFTIMINPVIVEASKTTATLDECCLSYPGRSRKVLRYTRVVVDYQLRNGFSDKRILWDFQARIAQHEIDHLDGKCKVGGRHD